MLWRYVNSREASASLLFFLRRNPACSLLTAQLGRGVYLIMTHFVNTDSSLKGQRLDIVYGDGVHVPAIYFRDIRLTRDAIASTSEPCSLWFVIGNERHEFVRAQKTDMDIDGKFSGTLITPEFMFAKEEDYHCPDLPEGVAFDFVPGDDVPRSERTHVEFVAKQSFVAKPYMTIQDFDDTLWTPLPY